MKNVAKVIFVIIGSIIGAGFASGKEIYNFFIIYGTYGIIGIILSSCIIGYLLIKVFRIVEQKHISNYDNFLTEITNKYAIFKKFPYILDSIKNIIKMFLLISFYIMIAAFSAYFSQEFGISTIIGAIILSIICYLVFMGSIERITKVNEILIPVLIFIIVFLVTINIRNFSNINIMQKSTNLLKSLQDAILYGSYNSIVLVPIIIPLKKYLTKKLDKNIVGSITAIILAIIAIAVFGIVLQIDIDIDKVELPTVYIAAQMGEFFKYGYGLVIIAAIFTSAISAGYGILENSIQNRAKYKIKACLMCITAILVSNIGFSWLVNTMYPIFGILGIAQILLILLY